MAKTLLFVQPSFDVPTSIQARFFNSILELAVREARLRKYNVVVLRGSAATESNFRKAIIEYDPEFIYFGGHGQKTELTGQYKDVLVLLGYNDYFLEGRKIYAFSCKAADIARNVDVQAFLGYTKDFVFIPRYLDLFMGLGFAPLGVLLRGGTFYQAYNHTKKLYSKILIGVKDNELKYALWHNQDALVLYGDGDARL